MAGKSHCLCDVFEWGGGPVACQPVPRLTRTLVFGDYLVVNQRGKR